MRRMASGALTLVVMFGLPFVQAGMASANTIAGGGFSSSYAGESVFTNTAGGETGQMSAIFFNDGTQSWAPGIVGLLVCAADKVTCNVPANQTFKSNWFSDTVYATVTSTVSPGQNGFFIYDFSVPVGTAAGTVTTFYGDVGLIATGAEFRPEGYFQSNTTPTPTFTLTMSPSSASVALGTTQQFTVGGATVGATATWTVLGGCGAVTAAGLFAATAVNSASQPCSVLASLSGATVSAPVTVYGAPSQLTCTASPTTVIANGGAAGGRSTITVALKDVNGNTVANASTPVVQVANSTPGTGSITPTAGTITPLNGIVTVTMSSTLTAGPFELSASASGLTGCFVFVTSTASGPPVATIGTFTPPNIAADGVSTSTLRIDTVDSAGNRSLADNTTGLTISGNSGAGVCSFTGASTAGTNVSAGGTAAAATVQNGRVELIVRATTTPGTCSFSILTNTPSVPGTTAALTTQIVGSPNQLAVISSDSPRPASPSGGSCAVSGTATDASCARVVVEVRDFNGSRITGESGRTIGATFDPTTCTGAGGGNVALSDSTATAAGRATFAFRSPGAYNACVISFNSTSGSTGVSGTTTTMQWTAGPADHIACAFSPASIPNDSAAVSNALVTAVDASNNAVNAYNYSITFSRVAGTSTTLLTSSPQTMSNGTASFTVRSTSTVGTDTYTGSVTFGGPVLPHNPTSCNVTVHP